MVIGSQDATLDFTTQPLTTSSEAASAGHILETFNFFNSNQSKFSMARHLIWFSLTIMLWLLPPLLTRFCATIITRHSFLPPVSLKITARRELTVSTAISHCDYRLVRDYLNSVPWDDFLTNANLDEALQYLYGHLYTAIDLFVPKVVSKVGNNFPRWFSPSLIKLVRDKKRAHVAYKKSNLYSDYLLFTNLRSHCKELTRQCYHNYVQNTESSMQSNIKHFWRFVNPANSYP